VRNAKVRSKPSDKLELNCARRSLRRGKNELKRLRQSKSDVSKSRRKRRSVGSKNSLNSSSRIPTRHRSTLVRV